MGQTPSTMLECHRCKAGFDISDMVPDTRFPCENCGAYLRVPKPKGRGGLVAAAAGALLLAAAGVVYVLTTGGGPNEPGQTGQSGREGSGTAKEAQATEEKEPAEIDLVQLDFEEFKRKAAGGGIEELLALGSFCQEHERLAGEAERAFRLVLKQDPEHEGALAGLDLACLEGLYLPAAEHAALVKSKWYANARSVLNKEVKDEQGLRDLGLSYAFARPFLIVRQRSDDDDEDRQQRRRAAAALRGMAEAFNRVIGEEIGVDATETTTVLPVFWYRTERAKGIWEDSRRPDIDEENGSKWEPNEHWRLVNEERVTRLLLSGFAELPAYAMVEALLCTAKAKVPDWLVDGLSCQIATLTMKEARLSEPVVVHDLDNPSMLRAVAHDAKRCHARTMVGLELQENSFLKELVERLKKEGRTNIKIEVVGYNEREVPSRDAWAFVRFCLKSDPARRAKFVDYVKRMHRGEKWGVAFHGAFAGDGKKKCDIDALDEAWVAWMKLQEEERRGE